RNLGFNLSPDRRLDVVPKRSVLPPELLQVDFVSLARPPVPCFAESGNLRSRRVFFTLGGTPGAIGQCQEQRQAQSRERGSHRAQLGAHSTRTGFSGPGLISVFHRLPP